jgi:tetrahydromethanopterin S-methyltransferase subunit G
MDSELTIDLKDHILVILSERETRVKREFVHIQEKLLESEQAVKDALTLANQTTKDALQTANGNIVAFSQSIDSRFNAINEFRIQMLEQLTHLARKADIAAQMEWSEKAILKAEVAVEKRFDSVNEFRQQMADMQSTLVRKAEVDIRFESLEKKLDARCESLEKKLDVAVAQLQQTEGRKVGMSTAWGIFIGVAGLLLTLSAVLVAAILSSH